MMRVSTKGRYGLRIMMDVALNQEKGPVILRDISRRQGISQKYLWQVINPLKGAGLVSSARGSRGGYILARPPEDITLRDIVTILEGPVSVVACVESPETCERSVSCIARQAWGEIEERLNDALRGITLKDLLQRYKDQEDRGQPSYAI
jgi:Rrf2 family protein